MPNMRVKKHSWSPEAEVKYIIHVLHPVKTFHPRPQTPKINCWCPFRSWENRGWTGSFPSSKRTIILSAVVTLMLALPLNGDDIFLSRALWKCSYLCWDNPDLLPADPLEGISTQTAVIRGWEVRLVDGIGWTHHTWAVPTRLTKAIHNDTTAAIWVPMNCELWHTIAISLYVYYVYYYIIY